MKQISDEYYDNALRKEVGEVTQSILLNEQVLEQKANIKFEAMVKNICSEQVVNEAKNEI